MLRPLQKEKLSHLRIWKCVINPKVVGQVVQKETGIRKRDTVSNTGSYFFSSFNSTSL